MTLKLIFRRWGVPVAAGAWSLLLASSAWSQAPPDLPQPLPEPPKAEAPKVPKAEAPKAEPPKTDVPKVEPKAEPPKAEPPKAEPPKAEPPKAEPPKAEPPKALTPKADPPAREPTKDIRDDARDAAKDAPRDARDAVRDVPRDARDAVRDTRDAVRDVPRDARDAVRDVPRDARDAVRDTRDAVRDTRDAVRDVPRDAVRGTRDALRGTGANIRLDSLRATDLGVTFAPARNGWLSVSALAPTAAIGRIGLRTGDYIMSINGQRLASEADFVRFLLAEDVRAAGRVPLVVWRDGRQTTLYVEPAMLVESIQPAQRAGGFAQFGVVLDDRYSDQIVVARVTSGSPAHAAGIRAGDLLTAIDGQRLSSAADLEAALEASGRSTVQVDLVRQVDVNLARTANAVPHTTFRPSPDGAVMPAQPTYTQPVPVYRDAPFYPENNARRGIFGGRRGY
jgi:hypothetical protein